jgi:hypothetical protein
MQNKDSKEAEIGYFENYPLLTVVLSSLVTIATYAAGALIMFRTGWICGALFLIYILFLEFILLRKSCRDCYYYGKTCAFGKGRLACLVVKRGNPANFGKKQMSWKSMIPDALVTIIPVITAIVLMIINFNWILLALVILLIGLGTAGNGYIRGTLACKYCLQRKYGCPTEKLFNRSETGQQAS